MIVEEVKRLSKEISLRFDSEGYDGMEKRFNEITDPSLKEKVRDDLTNGMEISLEENFKLGHFHDYMLLDMRRKMVDRGLISLKNLKRRKSESYVKKLLKEGIKEFLEKGYMKNGSLQKDFFKNINESSTIREISNLIQKLEKPFMWEFWIPFGYGKLIGGKRFQYYERDLWNDYITQCFREKMLSIIFVKFTSFKNPISLK